MNSVICLQCSAIVPESEADAHCATHAVAAPNTDEPLRRAIARMDECRAACGDVGEPFYADPHAWDCIRSTLLRHLPGDDVGQRQGEMIL